MNERVFCHLSVLSGILCLWVTAGPVELVNGSFEELVPLKMPPGGSKGTWSLAETDQAPATWRLSSAYPGTLTICHEDAADGRNFLRIAALPARAAHLCQAGLELRGGLTYEVTVCYRGGPVELKVYEYDSGGKLKADRAFATGEPTAEREGKWETLRGVYKLPTGITNATLALAIPAGSEADLDDVRISRLRRTEQWLNVRDYGASGSEFETTAVTTAGAPAIELQEIGDFVVGQQVAISKCNPHVNVDRVWSLTTRDARVLKEHIEARGYDGSLGNWTVYVLDFPGTTPPTFRWSTDLGLTWSEEWVTVTGGWQSLSGGTEVRFSDLEFWSQPMVISLDGRDQLISTILNTKGTTVTLTDAAPISAEGCIIQHTDSGPLQRAFDQAVGERRNIFLPTGRYRLTQGLRLRNAEGIRIEGENEEGTILDLSNGTGACISIEKGTSVTVRNLSFHGFSGFAERKQMGAMRTQGYPHMWGFFAKHCNAIGIRTPERLLVENCHATGMSAECFYSASGSRRGDTDPSHYTKSIVYRHCTVTDCARNAFNNNDHAENTAVLYCRVENVGGCTWEGASRFVKFVGNYVRNAGTVAIGNTRSRAEHYDILPTGQHIVAHNTFEQEMVYGGCGVRSSSGATPVIISNNIFVNFNTSAIETSSFGDDRHLPSANTIVTGNAIDLTCVRDDSRARIGIRMGADDATVSDNQIYVRGTPDPLVTGMLLEEPARNIVVHDNTVRGCGIGLKGRRNHAQVTEVLDPRTVRCGRGLAWPRRRSHLCRGDQIVWLGRGNGSPGFGPMIQAFDPDEGVFRLASDADRGKGARFSLYSPQGFRWSIHHNVIESCTQLVNLDVFGGPTAVFSDNLLSRGTAEAPGAAVEIGGLFTISRNRFVGFNDPKSIALMLHPDPLKRPVRTICRDNVFDLCTTPVGESAPGTWDAVIKDGNIFDCTSKNALADSVTVRAVTVASEADTQTEGYAERLTGDVVIDGNVSEWTWGAAERLLKLTRTHDDRLSGEFSGQAVTSYDDQALYIALRITLPDKTEFSSDNGVELSIASADANRVTPIYVLWCKGDGGMTSLTAMGADANQAATFQQGTTYAVGHAANQWTCEWRIAWSALGVPVDSPPKAWFMNFGAHLAQKGTWLVWVPTGGRVCDVENAGILRLR